MRRTSLITVITIAGALLGAVSNATATDLSSTQVTKSLETIKAQADAIASGHDKTPVDVRDAARTIGVEWGKVAPVVTQEFLVETRFANRSIATFEHEWQNATKARADAKDVSSSIAQLIDAERQSATPAPSSSPVPQPSASPTGTP
jgi:hypothetical protein